MTGIRQQHHRSGAISWYYRYQYHGQRRERPAGSEDDAIRLRNRALEDISRGIDPDTGSSRRVDRPIRPPSVAEIIDEYLDWLRPPLVSGRRMTPQEAKASRAASTSNTYANRFKAHFRGTVTAVSQTTLRAFAKTIKAGPGTINHHFDFLRAATRWWGRAHPKLRGLLPDVSWSDVRLPNDDEKVRDRRVSDKELGRLTNALPPAYSYAPMFAVETLLRSSELCALEWVDVRIDHIFLPAKKVKGRRGSRKARTIPLSEKAQAILALQRAKGTPLSGYVFCGPSGARLQNMVRVMRAACETAKLEGVTFHCFRHEGASRLAEKGLDPIALREMGGWSSLDLVQRYCHANLDRTREILNRPRGGANEKLADAIPGRDVLGGDSVARDGGGVVKLREHDPRRATR